MRLRRLDRIVYRPRDTKLDVLEERRGALRIFRVDQAGLDKALETMARLLDDSLRKIRECINSNEASALIFTAAEGLPTADLSYLGRSALISNTGTDDTYWVCYQQAAGTYAWRQVF